MLPQISSKADPVIVDQLSGAIWEALEGSTIAGVTSQADVLSAMFTVLDRLLRAAQKFDDPEDRIHNSQEIQRVLKDMILEFGSVTVH